MNGFILAVDSWGEFQWAYKYNPDGATLAADVAI
jgi:hypothetical protein